MLLLTGPKMKATREFREITYLFHFSLPSHHVGLVQNIVLKDDRKAMITVTRNAELKLHWCQNL